MKSTPRRPRSDTVKAAVKATQNAALGPIEPPACVSLRKCDLPFWERIINSKARDNWTEVDLVSAGILARCQADIEMLQKQIDMDGYVLDGKVNPTVTAQEILIKRELSMKRILQVHSTATVGKSPDAIKSATLEREARQRVDDGLIPKLQAVK